MKKQTTVNKQDKTIDILFSVCILSFAIIIFLWVRMSYIDMQYNSLKVWSDKLEKENLNVKVENIELILKLRHDVR